MHLKRTIWISLRLTSVVFMVIVAMTTNLKANPWIAFDYVGPDTIEVGSNCFGTLNWGGDASVIALPTEPGQTITSKSLLSVSGGYSQGSQVRAGMTVNVTYVATDNLGHTEQFVFQVYFVDRIPPTFVTSSLPPDITVNCPTNLPNHNISATDNCTPTFQINISVNINFPPAPCSGVYQRTWRAVDQFGNASTYTQRITLQADQIAPTITTQATNVSHTCGSNAQDAFDQWISAHGNAVAIDNCALAGWSTIPESPVINSNCSQPTVVTFVVSDFCGNSARTTASFQLTDVDYPTIEQGSQDRLINCGSNVESDFSDWLMSGGYAIVNDNCLNQDQLILTYSLNGEIKTEEELIEILKEQLVLPCQSGNVGGQTYDRLKAFLPITFSFSDLCGNEEVALGIFAVQDTVRPIIQTPGQDTVFISCGVDGIETQINDWYNSGGGAVAVDGCSPVHFEGDISLEDLIELVGMAPTLCDQAYSVLFHAVDLCGNQSQQSFRSVFRTLDQNPPEIIVPPSDYQLVCFSDEANDTLMVWIEGLAGMEAEDCNGLRKDHFTWLTNQGITGSGVFGVGPYPEIVGADCVQFAEVVFYISDLCGNISSDTARFNVGDFEPPIVITPISDTTLNCGSGFNIETPVFEDNCFLDKNIEVVIQSNQDDDPSLCSHYNYSNTITWTAIDLCGNSTTVTQVINYIDTIPPRPGADFGPITILCTEGLPDPYQGFEDDCSSFTVNFEDESNQSMDPADCSHYQFDLFRTYTVSDVCGNVGTYIQVISVVDITPPQFDAIDTLTFSCSDTGLIIQQLQNLASDNCSDSLEYEIEIEIDGSGEDCNFGRVQHWFISATDRCGNTNERIVFIKLIDQEPPLITQPVQSRLYFCGEEEDLEEAFNDFIINLGDAEAVDECNQIYSFAATPGSYDPNDPNTFPGLPPVFSMSQCDGTDLINIAVDFVFYDQCNNVAVSQGSFVLKDTLAPFIIACPDNDTILAPSGSCQASFILPFPIAGDLCGNTSFDSLFSSTQPISSDLPGNTLTLVNPVELNLGPFFGLGGYGSFIINGIQLTLNNIDGELATEKFMIYGEQNTFLGYSNPSDLQCGTSTTILNIVESQFIDWTSDGFLTIRLVPDTAILSQQNGGINDICGGTSATLDLRVQWNQPSQLSYSYAIDGGASNGFDINQPPTLILQEGHHAISYIIQDCNGNSVSCESDVLIRDTVPPTILCPNDILVQLNQNRCDTLLSIPLPTSIDDNCGFSNDFNVTLPSDTSDAWLTFAHFPDLNNFIAEDRIITFTNVTANVTSPVTLTVHLRANGESGDEYFTILGENNESLGTTRAGNANVFTAYCHTPGKAFFTISPAQFNAWAADGQMTFKAIANRNFTVPPGNSNSGVNPCPPSSVTVSGQTDSSSYMFFQLEYTTFTPPYYFATGSTEIPFTLLPPPYVPPQNLFHAGLTEFHYVIFDRSGNADTCSFIIDVQDLQSPIARCANAIIRLHPSGVIDRPLNSADINAGSTDNCAVDTMFTTDISFRCEDIGQQFGVKLYVLDASGNIDSCETEVKVEGAILYPLYSLGICDNDTLRLFSNIIDTALFNAYTYSWIGPNGFTSSLANPIIPSISSLYSGTYTLTVEGFNGCISSGTIEVFINTEINTPVIQVNDATVCTGQNFILTTQPYTGSVLYEWYQGIAPNGVLVATSVVPSISLQQNIGMYDFYVVVKENDCISNPSASVHVEVNESIEATVDRPNIDVCEGEPIVLGTSIQGPGITYSWTGPNAFSSNSQRPEVVQNANLTHAGIYTLVITNSFCISDPVYVNVSVSDRPNRPAPFSNSPVCVHNELVLTSNITASVDTFIWKLPNGEIIKTTIGSLNINDALAKHNGLWTLTLQKGGCLSDSSIPFNVVVQSDLDAQITYQGPICEGDSVQLFVPDYQDAFYTWTGPNGFVSNVQNPWVQAAFGVYTVRINTKTGCNDTTSISLAIWRKPIIENLVTTAVNCQYPDELVSFTYTLNLHPDSVSYFWSGPNGFASNDAFPQILGSNLINGVYRLVVTSHQGCSSDTSRILINVSSAPAQPVLIGPDRICSGQTLVLTSEPSGFDSYNWNTPQGQQFTSNPTLSIVDINTSWSGMYQVQVTVGQCTSKWSASKPLTVVETPAKPVITGDPTVCLGDSIKLSANTQPPSAFSWTGPNGTSSTGQQWLIFPANANHAGTYFVEANHDGCPSERSDGFQLMINQPPNIPIISSIQSTICTGDDNAILTLCVSQASATPGASYAFFTESGQSLGSPSLALCSNVSNFNSFTPGDNIIYARATLNGCVSDQSIPIVVNITFPPEEVAQAGQDIVVCTGDQVTLQALSPQFSVGKWTSIKPSTISNPNASSTSVTNLTPGRNDFVWSLSYLDCDNFSHDTVTVWVFDQLDGVKDFYRILQNESKTFDILDNDVYNIPVVVTIVTNPSNGIVQLDDQQNVVYTPNSNISFDRFQYQICIIGCEDICEIVDVVIDVDSEQDCKVPNIITPNGDGINDQLRIPCLQVNNSNSRMTIFNEWGTQVFDQSPYLNNWDGKYNGEDLPVGTYFFVFDDGKGTNAVKGFLIIKR